MYPKVYWDTERKMIRDCEGKFEVMPLELVSAYNNLVDRLSELTVPPVVITINRTDAQLLKSLLQNPDDDWSDDMRQLAWRVFNKLKEELE